MHKARTTILLSSFARSATIYLTITQDTFVLHLHPEAREFHHLRIHDMVGIAVQLVA